MPLIYSLWVQLATVMRAQLVGSNGLACTMRVGISHFSLLPHCPSPQRLPLGHTLHLVVVTSTCKLLIHGSTVSLFASTSPSVLPRRLAA
ncbi:unnamed protein product [Protopolystoma xenopodis]|uniref:Secreted protein n=1 Tax=Protopolystoma xenopodis TaxID=117903 RepID=A0A3S4ZXS1_9PLAT|nr:unnamed protein product [Protopolystoma xenopodis]